MDSVADLGLLTAMAWSFLITLISARLASRIKVSLNRSSLKYVCHFDIIFASSSVDYILKTDQALIRWRICGINKCGT
jgi:hypothetical protein